MRKTYQIFLALVASLLGATNVSAEEISLQEIPFWQHEVWGVDEPKNTTADCAWVIGESTGLPYGDSNVINFADLSNFVKLVVTVTDGSPRFLLNRDVDEGQFSENEAESHLIDNTKGGWCSKYFTSEAGSAEGETIYTVDIKQLVKDKGYAHLHAIKGANWANVTVTDMVVVSQGNAQQVGWTNIINNGDMEGDDVSSFFVALDAVNNSGYEPATISDGVGFDGSRGIEVVSIDNPGESWATQFFVKFNESLLPDARWRIQFNYRADKEADSGTGCHGEPRAYQSGGLFEGPHFTPDWQLFEAEGVVTAAQAGANGLGSIAFDLNTLPEANHYYFDNIKFEIYKSGTAATFLSDAVQIDFGFDTNLGELVKASGKKRLLYPMDCATVKVDGQEASIMSIEGFEDGRFYIFMDESIDDNATVEVTFKNPADPAYHLVLTSGPNAGSDVNNFSGPATWVDELAEDAFAYTFVQPTVMGTDPEDGSFNLPNSIKEFKVMFDKNVDCAQLSATINGKALAVNPSEGAAEAVTLVYNGGDFATGTYEIVVKHIIAEEPLVETDFFDYTFTVGIGKVDPDPNDQPRELLPAEYFINTSAGGVPEGFIVKFGEEERNSESTYGSGPRMFDFAEGGDFTKGLYFREGYAQYGTVDDHKLALEAGKKYVIHFNSAMWKDNGSKMKFEVLNENEESVFEQTINNTPNVNGNTSSPVTGSTVSEFTFTPDASGNYIVRWTSDGFAEVLLANPSVKYMPSTLGVAETQLLLTALENAKAALEGNGDERYLGAAYEALAAAIAKYEAEMAGYTAPSAYKNAAAVLDEAAQALKDHRALCDEYDTQIKKAIDVARQNADKKFANTPLYGELTSIVAKYNGTSEWVNEGDEETEDWHLYYNYDVLTDDAELTVAVPELKNIANKTSLLFTEGKSSPEGANGGKATGVAVLVDRLRLGAEALKSLGAAEDDWAYNSALNALTDDDELAEAVKLRIKQLLYGNVNALFEAVVDEETMETVTPSYDMTAFVKNPNTYKLSDKADFTDESVPGWTTPEGFNRPGLTPGWGQWQGTSEIAQDAMFQTWGSSYRVEQTITDLPAGIYTIKFGFGERNSEDDLDGSFAYVKNSDTLPVEDGMEEDRDVNFLVSADATVIGQAFPFAGGSGSLDIEDVEVVDGILTIGVNGGSSSHTFFNDVRVIMTAPAAGFDYAGAATEGIETLDNQQAKVRAIELYDLNGRRVLVAPRGVAIVKKHMSDGSTRTEKIVKK